MVINDDEVGYLYRPPCFQLPVTAADVLCLTVIYYRLSWSYQSVLLGDRKSVWPAKTGSNNYFRLRNTRTEMYAGRVACCPPLSHVENAPRALLRLEKRWDRRTPDRYITVALSPRAPNFSLSTSS